MLNIDTNTEFGARVARRLAEEHLIWQTTVRASGAPDPSPVWFLWDGQTMLIYSKPNTQKLRNITHNSAVALNFDGNGRGGDIIVINGTAQIDQQAPPAHQLPAYVAKYTEYIQRIGLTPEQFAQAYSVALRITPTSIRGH